VSNLWRLLCAGVFCRVALWKLTNIWKVFSASIIKVMIAFPNKLIESDFRFSLLCLTHCINNGGVKHISNVRSNFYHATWCNITSEVIFKMVVIPYSARKVSFSLLPPALRFAQLNVFQQLTDGKYAWSFTSSSPVANSYSWRSISMQRRPHICTLAFKRKVWLILI
jgi:hypothetical protein